MSKYKKMKIYYPLCQTAQLLFKNWFPKGGPTCRRQVVNPWHQTSQGQSVAKPGWSIYEDFGARGRYLRQGQVITSHSILWDPITCPCLRNMLLAPKSSYETWSACCSLITGLCFPNYTQVSISKNSFGYSLVTMQTTLGDPFCLWVTFGDQQYGIFCIGDQGTIFGQHWETHWPSSSLLDCHPPGGPFLLTWFNFNPIPAWYLTTSIIKCGVKLLIQ